ncbi:DNA primase [Methylomonas sp. HYX-M1]|uniref:DNA primase n=1 Tax=Methylomonas sp. HYX-M1 TaxID=3139307 RepID=UPI00345BE7FE
MSGRIPRQFIDDLLLRVDIVDLIDSYLPLKKNGSNYVARCPFHSEKTPSFSVSRNRQMYHCFGCGASGNAISFMMEYSHLGFVEAVEDLAALAGVEVPDNRNAELDVEHKDRLVRLYSVLEGVAAFYADQLNSPVGRSVDQYLAKRGIGKHIAREYLLGFAPQAWEELLRRFPREDLVAAGMLVVKDDGKVYDRFRGRLMFPIRDKRGRVIGFGGRVLDDSLPKYLNSPETPVYSKGSEVYGLYELLQRKKRPERIVVVEGYMDVIALSQFGIGNAVAMLGTATSITQVELLFRFAAELVFCFDGDNAGKQAAWRAVEAALPSLRDGRQIKIIMLPQGQDPDTLVREYGVPEFDKYLHGATALSDYFFEHLAAGSGLSTLEGRAALMAAAKPLLEKLPQGFFREMMWKRLRHETGLVGGDSKENRATLSSKNAVGQGGRVGRRPSLLRKVLALLMQYPQLAGGMEIRLKRLEGLEFPGMEFLAEILAKIRLEKPESGAILLESYRGGPHEKIVNSLAAMDLGVPEGGEEAEITGALTQLVRQVKRQKLDELLDKEVRSGLGDEEKQLLRALLKDRV